MCNMGIWGNTAIRFVNKTEDNAYIYKGFWYHNSKIYQNLETYSDIYPFLLTLVAYYYD